MLNSRRERAKNSSIERDLERMYQSLKKLGMRDSKTASAREYFTPQ